MLDTLTDSQFVFLFVIATSAVAWLGRRGFCAVRRLVRRYRVARFVANETRRPDAVPDSRTLRRPGHRSPLTLVAVSPVRPHDARMDTGLGDTTSLGDDLESRLVMRVNVTLINPPISLVEGPQS